MVALHTVVTHWTYSPGVLASTNRLDQLTRKLQSYVDGLGDPRKPRPPGTARKTLARAMAVRAPLPSIDAPEATQSPPIESEAQALVSVPEPPVEACGGPPESSEPIKPDPTRSIPCGYVLKPRPADWSAEPVTCGKLSSRWYCEVHHAQVFDNPINKVLNGRQRQRH